MSVSFRRRLELLESDRSAERDLHTTVLTNVRAGYLGGAQVYQYSRNDQRLWPLIRRVAVRAMDEARKAYQQ